MRLPTLTTCLIAILLITAVSTPASAQPPLSRDSYRYGAPGPRLSPYLDYFREDRGPISRYHSYVRPKIELERAYATQQSRLHRQGREIRVLGQKFQQIQRTGTIAPTGVGAAYFNYSHFYPNAQ